MISHAERFLRRVEEQGWLGQIVPIVYLASLQEAIWDRYKEGLLDKKLYKELLSSFSITSKPYLDSASSIIIVAVPTPPMRILFHWSGKPFPVIVPPTYVSYTPRMESVRDILSEWLKIDGFQLARPHLPLKTLAVQSGLASYGRNNICFVPGMGSFLQLVGAITDLPCDGNPWQEPKALNRCKKCTACLKLCPTGAITADRFLLHAERCLTYHNEAADNFPSWIHRSWHHCMIGCMRCQTACPENKHVAGWFEDRGEFSEDETALIVKKVSFDQLPAETVFKIKSLEINEDYQLLCRNLSMLIAGESEDLKP
jgi:epoxyqueuosine reductase